MITEYCGGELITEEVAYCPNCGEIAYPCPCGGDGVLPDDAMMRAYQEGLAFLEAIANDASL